MNKHIARLRTLAGLATVMNLGFVAAAHAGDKWPQAFPTTLSPSALAPDSRFGAALGVSGNLAIVGAPDDVGGRGTIYAYDYVDNHWDNGTRIDPIGAKSGDHFGASIAVDGAYIAVGAPDDDTQGVGAGAVYLYKRVNFFSTILYSLQTIFYASDAAPGAQFGKAVAAANGVFVVGAPNASPTKTNQGQVYTFESINSAWVEQKLTAPVPVVNEHFGASVAVDTYLLAVGSPAYLHLNPTIFDSGRVEVFHRSQVGTTWTPDVELGPPALQNFTRFGESVATKSGRVLVGAPGMSEPGGKVSGGACLYQPSFGIWFLDAKMTTVLGAYGYETQCGLGVALTPTRAFVASPHDVSEFRVQNGSWPQHSLLDAPFDGLDSDVDYSLGPVVAASEPFLFVGRPSVAAGDKGTVFPFYNDGGIFFDEGDGFGGAYGAPRLRLAGPLAANLPFELRMNYAYPQTQSILLVHAGTATPLPFHTGMLVAFPVHLTIAIPVSAAGQFAVPAKMPAGLAGVQFALQSLVGDPTSPAGFAMSNGITLQNAP